MLVVDATDCVYGGRDDMGPGKAAVLGPKTGRADCADAERGVRVPLWSSFCNSSSDKPVNLRSEFQTRTYVKHFTHEALEHT